MHEVLFTYGTIPLCSGSECIFSQAERRQEGGAHGAPGLHPLPLPGRRALLRVPAEVGKNRAGPCKMKQTHMCHLEKGKKKKRTKRCFELEVLFVATRYLCPGPFVRQLLQMDDFYVLLRDVQCVDRNI